MRSLIAAAILMAVAIPVGAEEIKVYRQGEVPRPGDVSSILFGQGPGQGGEVQKSKVKYRGYKDLGDTAAAVRQEAPAPAAGASVISVAINFDINSASLRPDAYPVLEAIVSGIAQSNTDRRVVIEGHTDASGSRGYNDALSERRAETVRQYLVSRGISPSRLLAVGYGARQPLSMGDIYGEQNRRVQFRASP